MARGKKYHTGGKTCKLLDIIYDVKYIFLGPNVSQEKLSEIIDMPDLKSEESAAQKNKQEGQELKILIQQLMLSRLPELLAQLHAGNNLKMKEDNCCFLFIDQKS